MASDAALAEVLARLDYMSGRMDAMASQLARVQAKASGRLSSADRVALTAALGHYAAGAPGLPSRVFNARELLADTAAREALRPVMGDVSAPGAPRRVGKLLARGDQQVLGGLHLTKAGEDKDGLIWRIARVRS